jgi:serine/arginine repetitive matrix protein 2
MASRTRFNSLEPSLVLSAPSNTAERPAQPRPASASESPIQEIDLLNDPLGVVAPFPPPTDDNPTPLLAPPNSTTGSLAIRAMRSMRSVARLATWTNEKPMERGNASAVLVSARTKDDESKRTKTKGKLKFELGRDQTCSRFSGSSSETGVSSSLLPHPTHPQPSITKKAGVLGLGLPSGFRFGTARNSSAGSSDRISCTNPLSESQGCSSSTVSAASSLRPRSAMSRISSSSSASVKWVEDRLETVRVACRRERRDETQSDSTRALSRAEVLLEKSSRAVLPKSSIRPSSPAIASEEASLTGHSARESESGATPNKQSRIRPASDQMIGKDRLRAIRGVGDG